jgi:hypothetical protein
VASKPPSWPASGRGVVASSVGKGNGVVVGRRLSREHANIGVIITISDSRIRDFFTDPVSFDWKSVENRAAISLPSDDYITKMTFIIIGGDIYIFTTYMKIGNIRHTI